MYDYFFPKNMRDSIEVQKIAKKNKTLAQQFTKKHHHLNQCELNKNGEQGSGGLGLHLENHFDFSYVAEIYIGNNPP